MSMVKLVLPSLCWAELSHIISYLTLNDVWKLGCCNRSAFITFLRERSLRKCIDYDKLPARFLSKWSQHARIALVSYPRSGNSFVRKLVETATGIVTGSDNRPNRTLAASLLEFGYLGEAIADNSVWVVKSHYPERLGYVRFGVGRVVLVVRNPYDALESYFHMGMTNTHDKALTREVFLSLKETWSKFVANEANIWVEFHKFWMRKRFEIPVLIIRYEDLMQDNDTAMSKITSFMLERSPPTGYQRYAQKKTNPHTKSAGYEPKQVKKFGKGLDVMSEEDRQVVATKCGPLMKRFGYEVITEPDPLSFDEPTSIITGLRILPPDQLNTEGLDPVRHPSIFTVVSPRVAPAPTTSGTIITTTADTSSVGLAISSTSNTRPVGKKNSGESSIVNAPEMHINDPFVVRPVDDPFGRNISDLRKGMTKKDTEPFATV